MIALRRGSDGHCLAILAALACAGPCALAQAPAPTASPPQKPLVEVGWGDHRLSVDGVEGLKVWAEGRWRAESWAQLEKPGEDGRHDYEHLRLRLGASKKAGPVEVGFEAQTAHLFGLDSDSTTGPGKTYLDANDSRSPQSLSIRQFWLELEAATALVRVGRQLYEDNGGLKYSDAAFQFVRDRGNARLVGNLDWPVAGRTFDGASVRREDEQWLVRGFGFEANEGAFAVDDAGGSLDDMQVAGLELVNKAGALVAGTELRAFGFVFRDSRAIAETKFGDELFIEVVGAQVASQKKLGEGSVDLFLWGAHESGDAGTRSQRAGAWIAESGYRFEGVAWSPWLRAGHTRAQGDSNAADGQVNDFYNGLPTNHAPYGHVDLFALSNLRDSYVDLLLDPHPQLRFTASFHGYALNHAGAGVTSGSGAFNEPAFGYSTRAVTSRNVGKELNLTLRATTPGKRVWGQLGWGYFWGGTALDRILVRSDVSFGYVEVGFKL